VVPEKQGLKLIKSKTGISFGFGLSSGSRKTRIETSHNQKKAGDAPGSK